MVIILHSGLLHTHFIALKSIAFYIEFSVRLIMEGVSIFIIVNGFLLINKQFDLKKHLRKTLNIFILLIILLCITLLGLYCLTKYREYDK